MAGDRCRDCGVSIPDAARSQRCSCCEGARVLADGLSDGVPPPLASFGLPDGCFVAWLPQEPQARLSVLCSTVTSTLRSDHATPAQVNGARTTEAALASRDATQAYEQLRLDMLDAEAAKALTQGLRIVSTSPHRTTSHIPGPGLTAGGTSASILRTVARGADASRAMVEAWCIDGVISSQPMTVPLDRLLAEGFSEDEVISANTAFWDDLGFGRHDDIGGQALLGDEVVEQSDHDRQEKVSFDLFAMVGQRPLRDVDRGAMREAMAARGHTQADFLLAWDEFKRGDEDLAVMRESQDGRRGAERDGEGTDSR